MGGTSNNYTPVSLRSRRAKKATRVRTQIVASTLLGMSLMFINATRTELIANASEDFGTSYDPASPVALNTFEPAQSPAVLVDDDETVRFTPAEESEPAAPLQLFDQWVNPKSSGLPWSFENSEAIGLLTFRGNPTRTFYGQGTVGDQISEKWSAEIGCSNSPVSGVDKTWCGTGWTGQPLIIPSPKQPGERWVVVGGYNKAINFFDPDSGEKVFGSYQTGDIIKGTPTADPDGFPLLYTGSRDNYFHIVALDGDEPKTLWRLGPEQIRPVFWNDDWDGSAMVIEDYLFIGGENSRFYILKLNRSFDENGQVAVDPVEVFSAPSWDQELLESVGDEEVSIENSVAISGNTVYFANSGGLVQGWNIRGLTRGSQPTREFRYWVGDDVDASIAIDSDRNLIVASQFQRQNSRGSALGQLIKLDPSAEPGQDPLLWSIDLAAGDNSGIWATPALYKDRVIASTSDGRIIGVDSSSGEQVWQVNLEASAWSSPVIIRDRLVQADCKGNISAFDLDTESEPELIWKYSLQSAGCIESTPAIWDDSLYVGSRDGRFYAFDIS